MSIKIADMQVDYVDHLGGDINVVNAARVSFAKEVKDFDLEKDTKLINYLAKHNHFTPLAHTSVTIRVKAPIFMARQFVKHQIGMTWNEESRRYIDDEPEFYIPNELRGRPVNAKQGSNGVLESSELFTDMIVSESVRCLDLYKSLLEGNVAPEQCRMVLPQNTMTNWMWTGSLVAFARVVKLRTDSHAQQEAQELAKLINDVVAPLYPVSWKALTEN
jgi:thymidylate synthase (FAD)